MEKLINTNISKSAFLDCMGEPGNGELHLFKMVDCIAMLHVNIF